MNGFFNKILIIDLTEKTFFTDDIPDEIFEKYLGGKGFGAYLMHTLNGLNINPLSPENHVIVLTGPINDTGIWGSSRFAVITKSPQTGYFSHSYSGGDVAEHISRTGYDAIILKGKSKNPIYLEISDRDVTFHDAAHIWGADTYDAEEAIKASLGKRKCGVIVIGPAGERLVRIANVVNNKWRCAGRTGAGAVFGSKHVKGIAFYGDKKRVVAHPDAVLSFHNEWKKKVKDYPSAKAYKTVGTPGLVSIINLVEAFPTRYWHEGKMDGWELISGDALHKNFSVKPHACYMCLLACGRLTEIKKGKYAGLKIEGPEYETIFAFGGLCLIKNLDDIIYLNDLCDRLGLDTISAGNLCAFAIEASRLGKIDEKIDYGDTEGIVELLNKIAYREGIGSILAEGILYAAKEFNMEDMAVHVKGLELPGYDPRFFKGMGLAYATSDRGACHLRTTFFRAELSGMVDSKDTKKMVELFLDFEDRLNLHDALILCRFYRDLYGWEELSRIIHMVTGMDVDKNTLSEIASNIQDATRLFNIREGMTAKEDNLPERFFKEPIGKDNNIITDVELELMKAEYYRLRGWDTLGIPSKNIK
ncbi:MAG: aldehyde ferredoxin oxidoreductase family protein [Syntrophorhabdaceae bacterium]|nr:aldehyde ferredoxin oxidoreductase family protein [Syntrophorhabdaceae bacterium]